MKERNLGVEEFRKKTVLAVCGAGTDRSGYIARELNERGYMARSAGVLRGHNYVTREDLAYVGIIVFSSVHEKNIFDKDGRLVKLVREEGIEIRVLNVTESDKDRAHCEGKVEELRENIARQLDCVGLRRLEGSSY